MKLVSETAAYDELELEKLLYSMCGDELLLDSNRYDCSRVFCLSTKVQRILICTLAAVVPAAVVVATSVPVTALYSCS